MKLRRFPERHGCVKIGAYEGRTRVGWIGICREIVRGTERFVVERAFVDEGRQRQGIGTKLYTEAARLACERGLWLASSPEWARTRAGTSFWEKQVARGHARWQHESTGGTAIIYFPCQVTTLGRQ
jgi:GNAT superfamily N-acetyltransferase